MFHLYGLILGLGVVVAYSAVEKIATKAQREMVEHASLWIGVGAIVGARIYHLLSDSQLYRDVSIWEYFAVWHGGLGIYGAVIGAVFGCVLYLLRTHELNRKAMLVVLDLLAFGLPLGQAIGRWGNFFNHELFGRPTRLPWGVFIPPDLRPSAFAEFTHFQPIFAYESIAMLALWVFFWKRRPAVGSGRMFAIYLIVYGLVRFMLDFLRVEPARWMSVPISQLVSLIAVCIGGALLLTARKKSATI